MRKVFLDNLPKHKKNLDTGNINWKDSVGTKIKFIYDDLSGYLDILDYKYPNVVVSYYGNIKTINTSNLIRCAIGDIVGKFNRRYVLDIGEILKTENINIIILDRFMKNGRKHYKYKCNICGYISDVVEYSLLRENRHCPCCTNKVTVKGYNDIFTTHFDYVKYFKNIDEAYKYTYSSCKSILAKCPICGYIKSMKIYKLINNGFSCDKCSDGISYPNKFMFNLLNEITNRGLINGFKSEVLYDWCVFKDENGNDRKGIYDFVIEEKKLIIEMDGAFHYYENKFTCGNKFIDSEKNRLANSNHYQIIRINCNYKNIEDRFSFIKSNVLSSELSRIIKLDDIDWDYINKQALNSDIDKAVKLWNDGVKSPKKIGEMLCHDRSTIRKYLKIGANIGMCNYSSDLSNEYNNKKRDRGAFKKSIICLNNNQIFTSAIEVKKYLNSINIMSSEKSIQRCCRNKSTYKGYIFRYTDNI